MWHGPAVYTAGPSYFLVRENVSTQTRTDASILADLETSNTALVREVAELRSDLRAHHKLLREVVAAILNGTPWEVPSTAPEPHVAAPQAAPAVQTVQDAAPPTSGPATPLQNVTQNANTEAARYLADNAGSAVRAALAAATAGAAQTTVLVLLSCDYASLTGGKPVAHETVYANVRSKSPRFQALRDLYAKAGKPDILAERSCLTWLASEDSAAPGHTRYAQIMAGGLAL